MRRLIPAMHELKQHRRFQSILDEKIASEKLFMQLLNQSLEKIRHQLANKKIEEETTTKESLMDGIFNDFEKRVNRFFQDRLQNVINATGVVLHTNLGRARLSETALEQIIKTAQNYSTLEFDLKTGKRGSRHDLIEDYLTYLTGAEAAIVVNNNAAAVYFILKAFAQGKEVIVSRGELVEIGGSFRISEIMEESGAQLVSVGTTNKTHLKDYEKAVTENTALFLKVHKSNFKMIGFTDEVGTESLVPLSAKYEIPIYEDLGSGTLFDFKAEGIGEEPTVKEKVQAGIDLISFSGDKLLGGPQAGVIVGKKHWINQLKKHQLARVLRVDKFTLAGLEATLKQYVTEQAQTKIPTLRDILTSKETIYKRAAYFVEKVAKDCKDLTLHIEEDLSMVGGGTMPEVTLKTYSVRLQHKKYAPMEVAKRLRMQKIPIIVRVEQEAVVLDFRTVQQAEVALVVEAFLNL